MNKYHFQFCPKLVILSSDLSKVLLGKRRGESDYDGVFSFIGGKMEDIDQTIVEGIKREKNEEIGGNFLLQLYPDISSSLLFIKSDNTHMIVSYYLAIHHGGEITPNHKEYSEYRWIDIDLIAKLEPKVPTIPTVVDLFLGMRNKFDKMDFVEI